MEKKITGQPIEHMKRIPIRMLLLLCAIVPYTMNAQPTEEKQPYNITDISHTIQIHHILSQGVPPKPTTSVQEQTLSALVKGINKETLQNLPRHEEKILNNIIQNKIISVTLPKMEFPRIRRSGGHRADTVTTQRTNDMVSVIGLDRDPLTNRITAYFTSDAFGKNNILAVRSTDNGTSWSSPTLAVKHNKKELNGVSMFRTKYRKKELYGLFATDKQYTLYASFKNYKPGEDAIWSYPIKIEDGLCGTDFRIAIDGNIIYLLFVNQRATDKYGVGAAILWRCKIDDMEKNWNFGDYFILEDNATGKWDLLTDQRGNIILSKLSPDKLDLYLLKTREIKNKMKK